MLKFDVEKEEFQNQFFEKKPLLCKKIIDPEFYGTADLSSVIYGLDAQAPNIRLHNGAFIPEQEYIETHTEVGAQKSRVVKSKFYKLLREGATLILNRLDAKDAKIRRICNEISKFTNHQTLANGYLSAGTIPAFGNHWDVHDVFAVQLFGRKKWTLYKPTLELPLRGQVSKDAKAECPTMPYMDIILEAGDVLYVPRGWWHNATAIGEKTFHIAIGVYPCYVSDYISWIVQKKLDKHLSCRRSVAMDRIDLSKVEHAIQDVAAEVLNERNFSEYIEFISNSDRVKTEFDLDAHVFSKKLEITPDSILNYNSAYVRPKSMPPNRLPNGEWGAMTGEAFELLKSIANRGQVAVADLGLGQPDEDLYRSIEELVNMDSIQIIN